MSKVPIDLERVMSAGRLLVLCLGVVLSPPLATETSAVPVPGGSEMIDPSDAAIGAGQTIQIRTRWDASGYSVFPNFTRLDGGTGSWSVAPDTTDGSYILFYTTGSMIGFQDSSEVAIPITALDPNDGSSFTDENLKVCRRNLTPRPEHLWTTIPNDERVFRSGDSLVLTTAWKHHGAPDFDVAADYSELVTGFVPGEETVTQVGSGAEIDTFEVAYVIPGASRIGSDRDAVALTIVASDALCAEVRSPDVRINIRTGPPPSPIEHQVVSPVERGLRDGDTLVIWSRWDAGGYTLVPDFTDLDAGLGGDAAIVDSSAIDSSATGSYLIRYTPGSMVGLPDQSVTIPIRAVDPLGDSFTDRTLTVCRNQSTPPPLHIESWIRGSRRKFRNTDSLVVYSRWSHPADLEISLEADFRNIAPEYESEDAKISQRGVDTFLVVFMLPATSQLVPDGEDIPFRLTASDTLCGTTHYDGLTIDLDTKPPPEPPTFDPIAKETGTSPIVFSGTAPGADRVAILRNDLVQFRVDVDENDRFSTEIDLVLGNNKLGGWSEDEIGNKTISGSSKNILYVAAREIIYPTPFHPGESITVKDAGGLRSVTIQIYNLEGDVVTRFDTESETLQAVFAWDGKDLDHHLAQPGYYLMRIRTTGADGQGREEILPMLFRND